MNHDDKEKTSFMTPFSTYCFVRMPEGLKNAGSTFARMTKKALGSQINRNVVAYVDDIVVMSKETGEHLADLEETFASPGKPDQ